MNITKNTFGELNSENVYSYSLENDHGMKVTCITLGCIITDIIVPDKNGNHENVVLGFDDIDSYLNDSPYFGTIVGRVAGRIGNAEFELDGKQYSLPKNENNNHLHGGPEAFDRKLLQKSFSMTEKLELSFLIVVQMVKMDTLET